MLALFKLLQRAGAVKTTLSFPIVMIVMVTILCAIRKLNPPAMALGPK